MLSRMRPTSARSVPMPRTIYLIMHAVHRVSRANRTVRWNEKIQESMHIPDNFLSPPVWATLDAIAIPAVTYVSRQAQKSTDTNRLALLGVMGAFVFAAQMINFPVGLGTSGHLVGAALLAYTLGPAAAGVVLTAILAVQALVFQDGGILSLGPNVINM